ncbi:YjjG family noncanonical pyrimidine nucleotidase [Aquirufa sp. ROCK2-A2]
MKFQPKAIFFDWDHTLWDHDLNAQEVIFELFEELNLYPKQIIDFPVAWETFRIINDQLWDQYQAGQISQTYLRENRFKDYFKALKLETDTDAFSKEYLYRTPRKKHLIPGAAMVVSQLAQKYPLYILTNGFDDIQYVKVDGSGIGHYFKKMITSEQIGVKKPDPLFFRHALDLANCQANEVLMIGDHAIADIQGAEDVGITSIHFQSSNLISNSKRVISQLSDLLYLIDLD